MKPNLFPAVRRIIFPLLAGAALSTRAQVALDPYLAGLPVEQRITQAPVFTHPLVYVGDQPPDPIESQELWSAIEVMRQHGPGIGIPALELFIETYTNSVWTPSLRNNLAYHYRNKGSYSLALQHWGAAWEATKLADSGSAKEVADFALAHLTRLLGNLGWSDELGLMLQESWWRVLDAGPLEQMFELTKENFMAARSEPEAAYRCGAQALSRVAEVLQPGNVYIPYLAERPSTQLGFSLSALKTLADQAGLNLVAVQRVRGQDLIVPCVVHWRVDHYAAITAQDGNRYKVEDSAMEQPIWMDIDTINAEASGYFLIPANRLAAGWAPLSQAKADQIIGRGPLVVIVIPFGINDDAPEPCPTDEDGDDDSDPNSPANEGDAGDPAPDCRKNCNNSGGPDDNGPNDAGCSACGSDSGTGTAMPVWKVAEPYINLWILDRPTFYTKSYGKRHVFKLMYKQRNTRSNPFGFGFGSFWECNRLAYFYQDSAQALKHYVPGGGTRIYVDGTPEYKSRMFSTTTRDGSGNAVSVVLTAPNAAVNTYSYVFDHFDGTRDVYLSSQVDRYGRTNFYNYAVVNSKVHLTSVVDHNGRSTSFAYGNASFPEVITQVTDPWGRSVQLRYESSGRLTNVVDAIGISSSFVYDTTTGWITNLVTPYGTTTFQLTGTASSFINDPTYAVNRSCTVTEPNGSKQLFIYRRNSNQLNPSNPTILIDTTWPAAEIPTLPYANTLNTNSPHMHNSFYWNRQQYAALNATFRSSGNFNDLTVADYSLPRRRHWLTTFDNSLLSGTLSVQRDPSPDGATLGQTTWYDYAGKPADYREGTESFPMTVARVLPNGQTSYRYVERNSLSRPTLIVTSYGDGSTSRTNQLFYYTNSRDLQYELGPDGKLVRGYSYNGNHQVLTFTNALGEVTTYNYDSQNRVYQRILPASLTSTFTYGGDGFVSQVTDQPINRTRSFTYASSFVYGNTDGRGLPITNYWDNLQRLTGQLYPDNTTISNLYTMLDVTATKDRLGFWTYFGYNAVRQKIAETNANNVVTRYGYCDCGSLLYVTNAFGTALQEITSFAYDYQGHRTLTFFPDGTSLTYKYDSLGRLTNLLDALSSTTYWYNNQGLLTAVSNAVGQISKIVYDVKDQPISVTDANGVTVTQTFDNLGRLLSRTYPDNGHEDFGYAPNVAAATNYTNQLSKVWTYAYDAASRKTNEVGVGVYTNSFTYSAASDLKTLTDGKNQVTTWNYDQYGRVTNKLDQANVEILRYQYDANSRLTNRWSKAKGNTAYSYDNVGNLTFVNYPSSPDITLQYDALNRLTNMVDAAGTTKYTYYAGGLLNTEDGPWASDTVSYTYNNARLRSGLTLQQPTGTWTNGFTYDAAHRLSTVSSPAGTFSYQYPNNQPSTLIQKLVLPNTSYITNTYDNVTRLIGTYLDNSSDTVLDKSEYLYNAGNQRIRLMRTDGSYYTNNYDNIGQLVWADSTVNTEDRGYLYDAAWNLNKRTNNGAATTFTVDVKNQLTGGPTASYTYDANGNLASSSSGNYTYAYDDENRLTTWTFAYENTAKTDFVYDGLSRLRKRIEYTWNSTNGWVISTETRYIYDRMRVIQERNSGNTPTVSYTRGNDLSGGLEGAGGIGGLLARSHGYSSGSFTNHNFYHADGGGNITYMEDASQNMVASYRYDPFGNTISSSGTLASANVYRFSSKEIHANSGLYYYGYRFYDPNLQRWLNRDPLGEYGGVNLYGYVYNDPVNLADPYGLLAPAPGTLPVIISIGSGAGGGGALVIGGVVVGGVAAVGLVAYDAYQLNQINQLNQQNQQATQQLAQKNQEYKAYKDRCKETPPPGLDPCAEARWKLQRNKDCKQMREDFANKWYGGNYDSGHSRVMQDLDRANKNLEDWIKQNCKPCP